MGTNPLSPVSNGKDSRGRFAPGNKLARGNPYARKVARLRAALFRAVKAADVEDAVKALMEQAKEGDRQALAEILDRTIGRAIPSDIEERLSTIETALQERKSTNGNH